MALPTQLGNYATWDSTDILNRFVDGAKPTVADWEALRQYMYPMLTQTEAQQHYAGLKTILDTYLIQGKVLDTNFFARLFEAEIPFNNYAFAAKYIDTHSPFYANNDQCFSIAFANGAKPNGTMFAGYLQALLSPTAFAANNMCGFVLSDAYNSSWMSDYVIRGSITMKTTSNIRAHSIADTVYSANASQVSGTPFTIGFGKACMCTSPYATVNAIVTLICRGKITDVGENVLMQTSLVGIFDNDLSIPTLRQTNTTQFTLTFTTSNAKPIFISNAYSSAAVSEGMARAYLVGA